MKRKLLVTVAVLLLAPLLSLGWLMKTESGLHWAYRIVAPKMPEEFSPGELSGTLAGPIVLSGVDFRHQGFEASAARVELDWNPWGLLTLKLDITDLQVESLRVALPAAAEPAQAAPVELPGFVMPVAMQVGNAHFDGIEIKRGETAYRITRAGLRLDANYNRFDIGKLEIESDQFTARLAGKITARQGYPHKIDFSWSGRLPAGTELSGAGVLAGNLSATRLQQQVQGLVQFEHSLELDDLLTRPRWRLTAKTAEIDIRLLDPALPEIRGSLEATAEGDLEAAIVNGRVTGSEPRLGNFAANFRLRSLDSERRYQGVEVEALDIAALDGSIAASGRVEWLPSASWTAEVSATGIDTATLFAEWPGRLSANFDTSGSIENEALTTRANIRRLEGELRGYPLLASGRIEWLDGSLSISALEASSGKTRFIASGLLGEALDLSWSLHSDNLAEIYPGAGGSLDAEGLLSGSREMPRIEAGIEGASLGFDDIRLGKLGGKLAIEPRGAGQFDIDLVGETLLIGNSEFDRVTVRADNQRIEAKLASSLGVTDIRLEGGLDGRGWKGTLADATIESREYSTWKLSAPAPVELSAERLTLARSCLKSELRGRICGALEATAEDWDLDLDIDNLPLQLLSNLVPPRLELTGIADLQASVAKRGPQPVEGKIDITLRDGSTQIALDSGEALRSAYREILLNLMPGSRGIGVTGRVSMDNGDHMQLDGQLPGTYLLGLDNGFREIRATLRGQLSDMTNLDALIPEFDNLAGLLEFELTIEGDPREPRIGGQARLSEATVDITRLDLPLTDLNITAEADGTNNINYRATAVVAEGSLQVSGNTRLDANAGWPSNLSVQTRNLAPRGLLAQLQLREIDIDGRFDGNAKLRFQAPRGLYGKIEAVSERGKFLYPFLEGELESLDYYNARARILLDENGITSETSFTAEDGFAFEGRYEFPGASLLDLDPQRQALTARASIATRQLALLQLLSPDIEGPEGNFELSIEATGTLASPQLTGRARLTDASVGIPRLGIRLTDIYLTGTSDDSDRFNFEIGARSGDGSLKITGSSLLNADRGWPTRLEINGEDFESARIPEASVNLSPALVVVIADRSIDISGDLRVPFARLQPRDVTTAETVSSDTVVIGGEESQADPGWLVTTSVNLILGERVAFYGYGFDGQLAGKLLIEQQPGQPTSGTGEITIPQGRYRAYGQRLDIENGRVLFTGGPVTNPGLDIRASRDSNGIITGLLVRGRLRQPHIELFSIPAMGETDILSYLLFGRPLETASGEDSALMAQAALTLGLAGGDQIARSLRERFGLDEFHIETADSGDQASLVVGRYLSPDVYVSYAVGLIESANSLNLRYRITDRWQMKVESGVNHGADLLYTIER